jgi:hypothetical protein
VAEQVSTRTDELEAARREVARLEHANAELRRVNAELAKRPFALSDSAAAAAVHRATGAGRTLLRAEGWDDWPRWLRITVAIGLRISRLKERLRR